MATSGVATDDLGHLARRVRVMAAARLLLLVVAAVQLAPYLEGGDLGDLEIGVVVGASVPYALLTLLVLILVGTLPRLTSAGITVSAVADAIWAMTLLWATNGIFSPLVFIVYVQLVVTIVLLSGRVGVELALAHTVGLVWLAIQTSGGSLSGEVFAFGRVSIDSSGSDIVDASFSGDFQAFFVVASVWIVTGATYYVSSLNDRDLRRSNQELAMLRELTMDFERSLDLPDVAEAITRGVVQELGYGRAVMWLAEGGGELVPAAAAGYRPQDLEMVKSLRLSIVAGPVAEAIDARQPVVVGPEDPRPAALADAFEAGSMLVLVPLVSESRLLGLLSLEVVASLGRARRLSGREARILGTIATEAALALDNARLHEELRDLATTDALTGLYNHRYFQQRLQEELDRSLRAAGARGGRPVSLILLDLDFFKRVNDRFGHPSGDEMLRSLARLSERVLRSSDVVCRYGGEEFAVILPEAGVAQAARVAERLREAIQRSSFIGADGRYLGEVTASFGVAGYVDGLPSRSDLIARADTALYRAKNEGRNRVVTAGAPGSSPGEAPEPIGAS